MDTPAPGINPRPMRASI